MPERNSSYQPEIPSQHIFSFDMDGVLTIQSPFEIVLGDVLSRLPQRLSISFYRYSHGGKLSHLRHLLEAKSLGHMKQRQLNLGGIASLRYLHEQKEDLAQQGIIFNISLLSGNPPYMHALTRDQLRGADVADLISYWWQNPGKNPTIWKVEKARDLKNSGFKQTHIDDNAAIARAVAGIITAPQTIYLMENFVTRRWKDRLPGNIIFTSSCSQATERYIEGLKKH